MTQKELKPGDTILDGQFVVTKVTPEEDKRNVERAEASQRRWNMLREALDHHERSTVWNALSIAARAFEEDIKVMREAAAALRAGKSVSMFAPGESGALVAERLAAQFEQQLKDTRDLIDKFE